MYDYWSHNRRVAAAAKYAEENPYTFPKSPLDDDRIERLVELNQPNKKEFN